MAALDVIRLVKGDERPVIILTLTDDVTGSAIDLSAPTTSIFLRFRAAGTTTLLANITCSKVGTGATGQIQFDFSGGILDIDPGMYEGEVVLNFNGQIQTVFDTIRFTVRSSF